MSVYPGILWPAPLPSGWLFLFAVLRRACDHAPAGAGVRGKLISDLEAVMALLSRARAIAQRLDSQEACCPMCLLELSMNLAGDPAALDEVRKDVHELWNACAWVLKSDLLDRLGQTEKRRIVVRALAGCARHNSELLEPRDVLHDFMGSACACLHICLSMGETSAVQRSATRKRAFENHGGHWPTKSEDLFQSGERSGVRCVLAWCAKLDGPWALYLLADMLRIAHPLVLFEIKESRNEMDRGLLVAIMTRLVKYARLAPVAGCESDDEGQPPLPPDLAANMRAAVAVLSAVHSSPDALPNALLDFAPEAQDALFGTLDIVLRKLDRAKPPARTITTLCAALYPFIPPPENLFCPDILGYTRVPATLGLHGVLYRALKTLARNRRICSGPECTTVAHQEPDAHFLVCGRCQLARYCSRECQLADWRTGAAAPHKTACPLLCKLLAVANVEMTRPEFEAAADNLDWDVAELRVLSLFTLDAHLLPAEVLLRAAEIHEDFWKDGEVPHSSASALDAVDKVRRIVLAKRAGLPINTSGTTPSARCSESPAGHRSPSGSCEPLRQGCVGIDKCSDPVSLRSRTYVVNPKAPVLQIIGSAGAHDLPALEEARKDTHALWCACAWALSFPEMDQSFMEDVSEEHRAKAQLSQAACAKHSTRLPSEDFLFDFMDGICAESAFWPTYSEQLFPYGEEPGVQSVLFWCSKLDSPWALHLLADMLRIAHPLVFYEIMESEENLHRDLLLAVMRRLSAFGKWIIRSDDDDESQPDPTNNLRAAVSFLSSVHSSPDALPSSLLVFAGGFESGLFAALQLLLATLDRSNPIWRTLMRLCVTLYHHIPTPDPASLHCPDILPYTKEHETLSVYGILFVALKTLSRNRRICSGPECRTVAHQEPDRHFLVCARCKLLRYCTKDCQLADWKRGLHVPHKTVCPLICKLQAVASVETPLRQFEKAAVSVEWAPSELQALSLFTVNIRTLPVQVLLRASDLHRELLGECAVPEGFQKRFPSFDYMYSLDSALSISERESGREMCWFGCVIKSLSGSALDAGVL
ncbi:hypothetical protein AURDEDRAFT_128125 [Auricularia subglabra TFB-10046 SS5]|nr:hypothetical protein AURDEDRAFT_128125 [Auricularia subglabra TFB-10046 SS5]